MTAQSSINKTNFGKYFLYKLRGLRYNLIAVIVFSIFSYPLFGIAVNVYVSAKTRLEGIKSDDVNYRAFVRSYADAQSLIGVSAGITMVMLLLLAFTGYTILNKNFRYLYSKKYVDMDMTLPVSLNTRFAADFLSGALVYFVPHIISIIVGKILISFAGAEFLKSITDRNISSYYTNFYSLDWMIDEVSEGMLVGLVACIMFYCLNLFVISLTARKAEARVAPIVMNFVIPILTMTVAVLSNVFYGSVGFDVNSPISASTSPIGFLYYYMNNSSVVLGGVSRYHNAFTPINIVLIVLFCLLYIVGAYLLIKHRKFERTGSSYAFNGIKHAVLSVITFFIVSLFSLGIFDKMRDVYGYSELTKEMSIISSIILTLTVFLTLDLLSGQKIKKIGISLIRYAVTYGASLLICFLLVNSGGFGAENYVPDISEIEGITLNAVAFNSDNRFAAQEGGEVSEFEPILKLHREILSLENRNSEEASFVSIDYHLKDGRIVSRNYNNLPVSFMPTVFDLALKSKAEDIMSGIIETTENSENKVDNVKISTRYINDNQRNIFTGEKISENAKYNADTTVSVPVEEFLAALKEDYKDISFDMIYRNSYRIVCTAELVKYKENNDEIWHRHIQIYSFCKNTLAVLEKYGCQIYCNDYAEKVFIEKSKYGCREFVSAYNASGIMTGYNGFGGLESGNVRRLEIASDELKEIISYCAPEAYTVDHIGEEYYYILISSKGNDTMNTENLVVRPEFNERVAEIFDGLSVVSGNDSDVRYIPYT